MFRTLRLLLAPGLIVAASATACSNGEKNGDEEAVVVPSRGVETAAPTKVVAPRIEAGFAVNAFPPTMPDTDWHRSGWVKNDCLRCHETGVERAPRIVHAGLPSVVTTAQCRTCHVLIPGQEPRGAKEEPDTRFAKNAFPPMIPASGSHVDTWSKDDCLLCHEGGIRKAPIVKHAGLPTILLKSKCRSCHVQVRAIESDRAN